MKTVIEMAREAGGYLAELPNGDAWLFDDAEQMERFAALVRAEAQAEEREACAKVCDAWQEWGTDGALLAKAIRARGDT